MLYPVVTQSTAELGSFRSGRPFGRVSRRLAFLPLEYEGRCTCARRHYLHWRSYS